MKNSPDLVDDGCTTIWVALAQIIMTEYCKAFEKLKNMGQISDMKNGNFAIFMNDGDGYECWWDIGYCPFCGTKLTTGNYHDYKDFHGL